MSIEQLNQEVSQDDVDQNARSYWKDRADLMGITYANNIPTPKLKELVQAKLAEPIQAHSDTAYIRPADPTVLAMEDRANALVRFKITVLDPEKANWSGMVVTVGNNNILVSRAIYFIDEPWHAERIIIDHLKEMKYLPRTTKKDKYNAKNISMKEHDYRRVKRMPCFHIEELPPLTEQELKDLAHLQAQNGTGQQEY